MAGLRSSGGVPKTYRGWLWTKILDAMVGSSVAQGDTLHRGASVWSRLAAGTAGNVLSTNGAAADPSWISVAGASGATYGIYKSSDESRSSTTLTADSALVATLVANRKYRLEFDVAFDASATPDFKYDFNFTGTTTSVLTRRFHGVFTTASLATGDTTSTFAMRVDSALNNLTTFTIAANDTVVMWMHVNIDVGASGGTFSFRWAPNTGGTNVTVRRNSTLLVTEV